MKKLLALLACALMAVTPLMVAGCTGGGNNNGGGNKDHGNKTVIYVEVKSGGTGVQWLVDAGARFSALKGDYSYEDGKSGVVIEAKTVDNPSIKNAETSNSAIIDVMGEVNIEAAAREGRIVDITDVLTAKSDVRTGEAISPLDKIPQEQRSRYTYNGKYYAGPSCEYYPVISYDKNLFDETYMYFVRPEYANQDDAMPFTSDVLNGVYYFLPVGGAINNSMKSCGPDGEYGTDDDGLPSSLNELIVLCEYLKSEGINPFNFTGGYKYYSNFLLSALYTSLQGYEGARNNYEFDGQSTIVTGYTNENLFGLENVKVPTTQVVDVTEATGYYTTQEVEKYYAEAFMALCIEQDWFGPSVYNGDTQKAAISKFVLNNLPGNKIAMHIDGSYWYNEGSEGTNYFEQWKALNYQTGFEVRDVRLMSLPVNLTESVQEGEGKEQALLDMNYGIFVINSAIASNTGLVKAAKDFLAFLYSDAELSAYTASTSILRSMDYSLSSNDANKISVYGKHLLNAVSSGRSKVVYFVADNPTFKANAISLQQSWTNVVFSVGTTPSLFEALTSSTPVTVANAFSSQQISASDWANMYKGN
ncbi:MAG: hypothetical protein IKJ19_00975 [Clostridia bacterium]|nr:hypothetical protein [Clostridia bacterium]